MAAEAFAAVLEHGTPGFAVALVCRQVRLIVAAVFARLRGLVSAG